MSKLNIKLDLTGFSFQDFFFLGELLTGEDNSLINHAPGLAYHLSYHLAEALRIAAEEGARLGSFEIEVEPSDKDAELILREFMMAWTWIRNTTSFMRTHDQFKPVCRVLESVGQQITDELLNRRYSREMTKALLEGKTPPSKSEISEEMRSSIKRLRRLARQANRQLDNN